MCEIYSNYSLDDYTNIEDCPAVNDVYDQIYTIVTISVRLLHVILFPFYIYVNKINRKRDEKVLIFPITNFFFKMVTITFSLSVLIYTIGFISLWVPDNDESIFFQVFDIFILCSMHFLQINNTVFNLLLIILAIIRFVVYFFPSTEKSIALAQTHINRKLAFLYLGIAIKDIFSHLALAYGYLVFLIDTEFEWILLVPYVLFYCSHVLIFLSALLYIPIMINIRKHSYLVSFQQNHPQRYIFWQTVVVLIFKSMTIPIIIIYKYFNFLKLYNLAQEETRIEMITIPLIIELSYLGCNKRNVTAVFSSFKHFLKAILGFESARVEPQEVVVSSIDVNN